MTIKETIEQKREAEKARYIGLAKQIDIARARCAQLEQEYIGTAGKIDAYSELLKSITEAEEAAKTAA